MTAKEILLVSDFGAAWTAAMLSAFHEQAARLGEFDRLSGDGDFGTNLAAAALNAETVIADSAPGQYVDWITSVSRGFLGTGGTSGALFGMFFRDVARCAQGSTPTLGEFTQGLCKGVATVRRYGKAAVGDKTMVDALDPAAYALAARATSGAGPVAALTAAAEAAVTGARSTVGLRARRGRASYVGDVARGVLDPGAAVAALAIQAAAAAQSGAASVDTTWLDSGCEPSLWSNRTVLYGPDYDVLRARRLPGTQRNREPTGKLNHDDIGPYQIDRPSVVGSVL